MSAFVTGYREINFFSPTSANSSVNSALINRSEFFNAEGTEKDAEFAEAVILALISIWYKGLLVREMAVFIRTC